MIEVSARLETGGARVRGTFEVGEVRWLFRAVGETEPRVSVAWDNTRELETGWPNPLGRRVSLTTKAGVRYVVIARIRARAVHAMREAGELLARQAKAARHDAAVRAFDAAARTGVCPACREPAFKGKSTFQHTMSTGGGGGGSVHELAGRCSACGHSIHDLAVR